MRIGLPDPVSGPPTAWPARSRVHAGPPLPHPGPSSAYGTRQPPQPRSITRRRVLASPLRPSPYAASFWRSRRGCVRSNQGRRVHPDVSFATLAGAPLAERKTIWAEAVHRRRLLADAGIRLHDDLGRAGSASAIDVLDAAAATWTANRVTRGRAHSVPDPPESSATRFLRHLSPTFESGSGLANKRRPASWLSTRVARRSGTINGLRGPLVGPVRNPCPLRLDGFKR
jgi:hypothetical protein